MLYVYEITSKMPNVHLDYEELTDCKERTGRHSIYFKPGLLTLTKSEFGVFRAKYPDLAKPPYCRLHHKMQSNAEIQRRAQLEEDKLKELVAEEKEPTKNKVISRAERAAAKLTAQREKQAAKNREKAEAGEAITPGITPEDVKETKED